MSIERRMRGRVHYGWIVVAVTFVTLLAAAGIRSAPGVLMIPLEREFGWTRTTVSFAVSVNLFLLGIAGDADVLADVLESRVGLVTGQRLGIALALWAMLAALETGSGASLEVGLGVGVGRPGKDVPTLAGGCGCSPSPCAAPNPPHAAPW